MGNVKKRNEKLKEIFSSLSREDQRVLERMKTTFNGDHMGINIFIDLLAILWNDERTREALQRGEFGWDTLGRKEFSK